MSCSGGLAYLCHRPLSVKSSCPGSTSQSRGLSASSSCSGSDCRPNKGNLRASQFLSSRQGQPSPCPPYTFQRVPNGFWKLVATRLMMSCWNSSIHSRDKQSLVWTNSAHSFCSGLLAIHGASSVLLTLWRNTRMSTPTIT